MPGLGLYLLSTWYPHNNTLDRVFWLLLLLFAFITAFYPYITEEAHGAQRGYEETCKGHTDTLTAVLTS